MSTAPAWWADARRQWREQPRLRAGILFAVGLVAAYLLLMLNDWRVAAGDEYRQRSAYMQKLRGLAEQPEWLDRAQAAARTRKALDAQIGSASTLGIAQAEVQAWARERAAALGGQVRITGRPAAEVEQLPGVWRVPITLSGTTAPQQVLQLMQQVEQSPTLAVIEEATLLNRENRTFSVTVAFVYRIGGAK